MEIWIKYNGPNLHNYTRFGKPIPNVETKIDVSEYFGCPEDKARIEHIILSLKSDEKIDVIVHKSAGQTQRNDAIKIEEKATKQATATKTPVKRKRAARKK